MALAVGLLHAITQPWCTAQWLRIEGLDIAAVAELVRWVGE